MKEATDQHLDDVLKAIGRDISPDDSLEDIEMKEPGFVFELMIDLSYKGYLDCEEVDDWNNFLYEHEFLFRDGTLTARKIADYLEQL